MFQLSKDEAPQPSNEECIRISQSHIGKNSFDFQDELQTLALLGLRS